MMEAGEVTRQAGGMRDAAGQEGIWHDEVQPEVTRQAGGSRDAAGQEGVWHDEVQPEVTRQAGGMRDVTRQDEEQMLLWLGSLPRVGLCTSRRLMGHFHSVAAIYGASREELAKVPGLSASCIDTIVGTGSRRAAGRLRSELDRKGIRYLSFYGGDYPKRLRTLFKPPKHLYVRGRMPDSSRRAVGIVGARECTAYGRDMARLFGYRLAEAGVDVISGMALGIDGWAHQGALESGGSTYAVLGCGVDICYPSAHRRLYAGILRRGGVLSELSPGTPAKANFFPMRNRIISGLSDGILVVEAREKSGSLITADAALEQGKDVFVIPGRIGDGLSVGCNRLIRQGAIPVLSPADILEYYGIHAFYMEGNAPSEGAEVLRMITARPVHISQLEQETGADRTELMKSLMKWKKEGRIREVSRGYFISN